LFVYFLDNEGKKRILEVEWEEPSITKFKCTPGLFTVKQACLYESRLEKMDKK
jgi:hypothetical protein